MNKVECVLDCGHSVRITLSLNPSVGELKYCRLDGWQGIREIHWTEYRVVCCHCVYGRWTGQNATQARRLGRHHERIHAGHVCVVVNDTVTTQGGTPRQKIASDVLKELRKELATANVDPVEREATELPPPF